MVGDSIPLRMSVYSDVVEGKGGVYSLKSSLKTYHSTVHFIPWSLDLFIRVPFQ